MTVEKWDGGEMVMGGQIDAMLEHTGTVIEVDENTALIETVRRSACGHCSSGDSCGTSVLAGLFNKRGNFVRVSNHLHLQPGDQAVLGIAESTLLRAALWAYMVPLIVMIAFAMFASAAGFSDGYVFIASMAGLFNGLYLARLVRTRRVTDDIVLLRAAGGCTATVNLERNLIEVNTHE
jgi:sigma-E factor negative regulatory protein RseC